MMLQPTEPYRPVLLDLVRVALGQEVERQPNLALGPPLKPFKDWGGKVVVQLD